MSSFEFPLKRFKDQNCKICSKYCCHVTHADEVAYHDDIEIWSRECIRSIKICAVFRPCKVICRADALLERDVGKERITKMVPFKYFFWSALFGGIIGGICGVMLTFKIYVNGNEEHEEPAEDPNEEELQAAIQEETILVREPVEHDERTERSY